MSRIEHVPSTLLERTFSRQDDQGGPLPFAEGTTATFTVWQGAVPKLELTGADVVITGPDGPVKDCSHRVIQADVADQLALRKAKRRRRL